MFDISIDELIHGKTEGMTANISDGKEKQAVPRTDISSLGNLRGTHGALRLKVCALLTGMLCIFCCTVFAVVILQNAWNKDKDYVTSARVERVYQQYTKADISFSDDESRRVLKTVWLDTDGIRDGDYVECYTDAEQQKIYLDYYVPTLVVPGIFVLLFLCILILLFIEIRRMGRENQWNVVVWAEHEKESGKLDE